MDNVEIIDIKEHPPDDVDILSFWEMMFAPDQIAWDYDENQSMAEKPDHEILRFFRETVLPREMNDAFWARADGLIVGMAGIDRFTEPSKAHCAELGFGVRQAYQRRGIGYQLVIAALKKARALGLKRVECSCFADNAAAIHLLEKTGFHDEGLRIGAIQKRGRLRDIRLFGLIL
jgi:RimJ/RimL family protein N-acetyltransferase